MQEFVKQFNTNFQPLLIALDSSGNPVFLETAVPRINLKKHYISYLPKHSIPSTGVVPVVQPQRSCPAEKPAFLIQASGTR